MLISKLIGRLIYLTHIALDIVFLVSIVGQFMNYPREEHMEAVYGIQDPKLLEVDT